MIPHETIAKLDETFAAVSTVCGDLSVEQWATPTECPGWDIQDTVSHLIATERMLQGLPGTDHRLDPMPEHVKNPIGQFNEQEIDARRSLSGAQVLAEWNDLAALRLATLRGADDAYFDAAAMTPTGPGTVADFLDVRVLDVWSHEQDIRRALGRPGNLGNPSAGHTIDRLLRTVPIVVGKRAACPEGEAVELTITGPTARHVIIEVIGGRATPVASPSRPPLVTLTMDTESFVVLALGRRGASDLPAGAVQISGDQDLAARILATFSTMI